MSHDIRTPLNAILGMSELGLREESSQEKDNCFRDIRGSGRVLLENINSILDLSKIEAGKMEITPESYRVLSAFHDIITILRMRAQRRSSPSGPRWTRPSPTPSTGTTSTSPTSS